MESLNFQLIKASAEYEQVISNLMQFYMYDFSEYTSSDVEPNGLFSDYPYLKEYWKEENHRFPYVIMKDEKYIGFVLVRIVETEGKNYFSIGEFFIMRKYRRKGFGRIMATQIFNLHRGQWEVYQMEANKSAHAFWSKTILEYTTGQFKERTENGRTIQCFEND
jgi:predicted acetyltransferase